MNCYTKCEGDLEVFLLFFLVPHVMAAATGSGGLVRLAGRDDVYFAVADDVLLLYPDHLHGRCCVCSFLHCFIT